MVRHIETSLSDRFQLLKRLRAIKNKKELVLKYHELIGEGQVEADRFITEIDITKMSIKQLFFILISHYDDLAMLANFYFTVELLSVQSGVNINATKKILDYFSYSPGELESYKTEFLFLNNPVWQKPIIKYEESYFCLIPQLFFSFILSSMDEIIEKIDKDALHDRRSKYLEKKIEEIVKRRFPEALTISGVEWYQGDVRYETDLITFIDSHAIIIEAKSHKISKEALRGAPKSIKEHIVEILVKPSIQSKRLEEKLNELRLDSTISNELREKLPVDLNKIHNVLRVSVTLEDFASLQANFSKFDDTEWLPQDFHPCPTMNLADFETLFDLLEHPVQIIHYLQRRTELEGAVNFLGGELDFMGLYLTTLLNLGGIKPKDPTQLVISGLSEPIDLYYMSQDQGININKPKPKISKLFNEIFLKLGERAVPRWTEIGVILSRFSPDDQLKIERAIHDLTKGVNRTWHLDRHTNSLIHVPPETSKYALAFVLYKDTNADKKNEFIENAVASTFEPEYVKFCLAIAKNIDRNDLPYHSIRIYQQA